MEITIKNKFYGLNGKSIPALSFILCLSTVCMLASFGYAQTVSEEMDPGDLLESDLSPDITDINTSSISEDTNNWQPDMQVFQFSSASWQPETISNASLNLVAKMDKSPADLQGELQQLIQQIKSVEFKPQESSQPLIVVPPADKAKPDETASKEIPQEAKTEKPEVLPTGLPGGVQQEENLVVNGQITNQTMQLLEQLLQKPEQIKKPLELADILFRTGRLEKAAVCYRQALNQTAANDNVLYKDKSWILFQIGNCLQKDDPTVAAQMYKQLITEYPNSPWVDAAKAKDSLVDWYLKEKPDTLINERKL